MFSKETWQHLRIPFSYYLLPVFLFALSQVPATELFQAGYVTPGDYYVQAGVLFVVLHLLLYPASNGFNSYYDRDEGSIGGLKNPPPVSRELLRASLLFDGVAILVSFLLLGAGTALMVVVYGLVSKAYSHPRIRLKKYPVLGWITICVFQGAFVYGMTYLSMSGIHEELLSDPSLWGGALISSVFLGGFYPLTQVYQHAEDWERGDRTMSVLLGVRGTFGWTTSFSLVALGGFFLYFYTEQLIERFQLLLLFMVPPVLYFIPWWRRVWRDPKAADYRSTMWMIGLMSTCLSGYFGLLLMLG